MTPPMRTHTLVLATTLLASSLTAQAPAGRRPMTAEDYFQFELVSDPRISPDGSRVAYVVARVDRTQNRRVPSIWVAPTDVSQPPHVLVDESWSPSAPR